LSAKAIRKREEIEEPYKWKLENIYTDEQLWEKDLEKISQLAEQVDKLQGTLGDSAENLLSCLQLSDELGRVSEKAYVYARMRRDENNANYHYQALFDRIQSLTIKVGSITSFIVPEILTIPEERLMGFLAENKDLVLYRHFIDEILRQQDHILSPAEERLMAMSADLSLASGSIFTMLNNADIKFPVIKDESGQEVEITKGRYGSLMESSDRRVRQEAYEGLYSTYRGLINTLGASLSASVKKDIFYARVRKYESARAASLDQDNVPVEVYDRLIESVHNHLDLMYRYMDIRKKILGLDELRFYDLYTPLVPEYKLEVPYEQAKETLVQALQALGPDYLAQMQKGFSDGWIDVYENEGKTSGAYSWGAYDTSPYILMNYDDKLDDMFTLAHEMGHSLHSYYSNRSQPYVYSQYSIFVAEVASTVNESLLIDYLLERSTDPKEKIYLINHYLEQFRGTVYRQTMFAEFEKIIHEKAESGEALTPELLKEIYRDLNTLYYGPQVAMDEYIPLEWSRIPHFYSAFYVYKYATGFATATALKEQIKNEGQPAVQRYLEFLKSGGSDYPINLLQKAGVDLLTPEPVSNALAYFGQLLDQLEELLEPQAK